MCGLAKEQQFAKREPLKRNSISASFFFALKEFRFWFSQVKLSQVRCLSLSLRLYETHHSSELTQQRNAMPAAAAAASSSRRCCQLEVSKRWRHSCKQNLPRLGRKPKQTEAGHVMRMAVQKLVSAANAFVYMSEDRERAKSVREGEGDSVRERAAQWESARSRAAAAAVAVAVAASASAICAFGQVQVWWVVLPLSLALFLCRSPSLRSIANFVEILYNLSARRRSRSVLLRTSSCEVLVASSSSLSSL